MTISTVTNERLSEIAAEDDGSDVAFESSVIARELLAVREAKPVAYRYRYNGKHLASAGCGDMISSWKYCEEADLVNPDDRYEHQALFTAPPAPAVPEDVAAALDWIDDFIARCNGDDRGACNSVNVLRAAMLQPVSQGYTLNSPVIPDGWKLVPNEPTIKQWATGHRAMEGGIDKVTLAYRAMVEVAPSPGGPNDSHATAT